jgi:2-C-methyl-D-erythritol 4-phosphate cytidylyltransferase
MNPSVQLLIPAGGMGKRLGQDLPKALVPLGGRPLIVRTLERFRSLELLDRAVITVPQQHQNAFQNAFDRYLPDASPTILSGGPERQDSVRLGLAALAPDTEIVVIHDAARPFPPVDAIRESIRIATNTGAATVAIHCSDTILQADANQMLCDTPNRETLWACQTPQVFRKHVIVDAHEAACIEDYTCTDDASLVKWHGTSVALVPGTRSNLKITTPEDLRYAEYLLEECSP